MSSVYLQCLIRTRCSYYAITLTQNIGTKRKNHLISQDGRTTFWRYVCPSTSYNLVLLYSDVWPVGHPWTREWLGLWCLRLSIYGEYFQGWGVLQFHTGRHGLPAKTDDLGNRSCKVSERIIAPLHDKLVCIRALGIIWSCGSSRDYHFIDYNVLGASVFCILPMCWYAKQMSSYMPNWIFLSAKPPYDEEKPEYYHKKDYVP